MITRNQITRVNSSFAVVTSMTSRQPQRIVEVYEARTAKQGDCSLSSVVSLKYLSKYTLAFARMNFFIPAGGFDVSIGRFNKK
jgi:hypothetical protein